MKNIFKEYDAKTFRTKRQILNVTMDDLADICGLTRQTISYVELGKYCKKSTVILIGIALDKIYEQKIESLSDEERYKLKTVFSILDKSCS